MDIKETLKYILEKNENKIFLDDKIDQLTYSQVFSIAISLGEELKNIGYERGDVLVFTLPNSMSHLILYLACLLKGFIALPVISFESQNFHISKNSLKDKFAVKPLFKLPSINQINKNQYNINNIKEYIQSLRSQSIFSIHSTSGTTGKPKIIIHTVENILGNAISFNNSFRNKCFNNFGHFMPMFYMAGFLNCFILPLINQSKITIFEKFNNLSALNFWDQIISKKIDFVWLTPTMIQMINNFDRGSKGIEYCKKNNFRIYSATAPLSDKLRIEFQEKYHLNIINTYGMTETLFISTCDENGSKEGSVGHAIDYVETKVVSLNKKISSLENEGELYVKTKFLALDLKNIRKKNNLQKNYEYFSTGDLASIDKSGFITIKGRIKDIIIRGGINYSPKNIEDIINQSIYIKETSVIGINDKFYGEIIVAFIVIKNLDSKNKTINQLQINLKNKIGIKINQIICIDNLPRNQIGKINKLKLKELYKSLKSK